MKNLDTKLLRSFVSVAETKSMTEASQETGQTQGAVSQQIKRLEALLGQKLFLRTGRGMILTVCGTQFLPDAQNILTSCDSIFERSNTTNMRKTIRFGMPYDLVATYLSSTLDKLSGSFPEIDVDFYCDASPALKYMVRCDELDLVMIEEPVNDTEGDILSVDPLVWIGKPDGKAHRKRPLPVSLVAESCVFSNGTFQALNEMKVAWRAVFQNGNLDATMATVRSDFAVTAGLKRLVPADLRILTEADNLPELPRFAISLYPKGKQLHSYCREFSELIQRTFAS